MKIFSIGEMSTILGVSRTTLARWEEEGSFPRRVHLGRVNASRDRLGRKKRSNCRVGYLDSEFDTWLQERKNNRLPFKEDDDLSDQED
jgi:predicted DNA-binding transcriptional regulator AlpA